MDAQRHFQYTNLVELADLQILMFRIAKQHAFLGVKQGSLFPVHEAVGDQCITGLGLAIAVLYDILFQIDVGGPVCIAVYLG